MKHIKYEVCCGCAEDVINAAEGGADRVELNSALFLGGLTPSVGVMEVVRENSEIEVMAMIRPREGGFCYDKLDIAAMRADANALLRAGANGIVFGFLKPDASLDEELIKEFVDICGDSDAVFHRAIDLCNDLPATASRLAELGIKRILTSGGKPTAFEGIATIKAMVKAVGNRCEILPGGGINKENSWDIVRETGVTQIHSSARSLRFDNSSLNNPEIFFGGKIDGKYLPENQYKVTDKDLVEFMITDLSLLSEVY